MEPKEIEKFFADLPKEEESLQFDTSMLDNKPEEGTAQPIVTPEPVKDDEVTKNRAMRRMEKRIKELEAQTQTVAPQAYHTPEPVKDNGDTPLEWLQMYGDTEDTRKAWKLQASLLEKATSQAEERALARFKAEGEKEKNVQKEWETYIDTQLENIEDKYNIDIMSNAPVARKIRTEFLNLVTKLSPKDDSGNITSYADFESTFEIFKDKIKESKQNVDAKKEIAARSMNQSSGTPDATPKGPVATSKNWGAWREQFNI